MIKLAFFDIEGTLFKKAVRNPSGNVAPSIWMLLSKQLGTQAYKEELAGRKKWNNKEYAGYVEWMEDTLRIYKKYNLKKETFEYAINTTQYNPGVLAFFNEIKGKYRTATISGGFKALADRAQVDLRIDHAFTACELFWNKKR